MNRRRGAWLRLLATAALLCGFLALSWCVPTPHRCNPATGLSPAFDRCD